MHTPFHLMAMTTLAIPMDTITMATAMITETATMTTTIPAQCWTRVTIATTDQQLLYSNF
uniref:Secreted protein n=1 Tax=Romanomermis culicivorax TaxID=13658 RepID=A0A915II93_ROMCU